MLRRRSLILALLCLALVGAAAEEPHAPPADTGLARPAPARGPEEEMAALRPVPIGRPYLAEARRRLEAQLARLSADVRDRERWLEDNALVVREFLADVQVMYALELPEGARLVSHGMMRSWGMDPDRLHQRALANLDAHNGELRFKPVGKLPWLHVLDAADGYAASRVLLSWRWAELAPTLGGALVLAMPTRDVVVFTARQEAEKLEQLRDAVDTVERHQGRPVTRKLFRWTPQGWQELE